MPNAVATSARQTRTELEYFIGMATIPCTELRYYTCPVTASHRTGKVDLGRPFQQNTPVYRFVVTR